MRGGRWALAAAVAVSGCAPSGPFPVVRRAGDAPVYELRDGRWYDGRGFVAGTRWSVYGVLTVRRPAAVDSVIDLGGRWVIPALGEAHNHNAIPGDTAAVARHLRAGVFHVKNPNNLPRDRAGTGAPVGTPRAIDVAYANGGITGPGGHPIAIVRRNLARGNWTAADGETFMHVVATRADLDRTWPAVRAGNPDFIKAYLLYSEEHARRVADTAKVGWRGLDPALLPEVVRRAHADGRRVTAHVETAADFRTAVAAGVDEIGHLPGFRPEGGTLRDWWPLERFRLTDDDARRAATRGVVVVPTVSDALELLDRAIAARGVDADSARRVREVIVANLAALKRAGVRVAIGSDRFRATSDVEAMGLRASGVFSDAELLHAWSVVTPRAIFPARRVGGLATGDEASLLVLDGDPTIDLANTARIRLRVKQGWILR